MREQEFGPRRSKETVKPGVMCQEIVFYYCKHCKNLFQLFGAGEGKILTCCGEKMQLLDAKSPSEVSECVLIDYKITGGYNENAVEVFWKIKKRNVSIKWIYIKTFTGGQIKYVTNPQKTSFIFALADEDAYAYCDEDPCLECVFQCKRGFEIYAYMGAGVLIKVPLEKMHANWQS
ncbi:hypothetical protein LN736_12335 [Clostridium sp. WLY-B-L2]|uniref:Desulfoferrodoxin N-terminal domain-containing protein n=1 Tax=Clostridium aromativorans TaxID=2836848 RepID=A0ABS8N790_9CLOT|nr:MULTISPECIES: hypothetical protein [Clostridium]KAA8674712.1 hypothetical protein F3O63_06780 [Clostridium sp. HV4-5-A1G]MCC9295647.1 hypothetical protein [Clostridium aromativorans]CAB1250005.1 Desulfoferrod_N domain-containing protein [Clostridiaceae bacterium BL-3]